MSLSFQNEHCLAVSSGRILWSLLAVMAANNFLSPFNAGICVYDAHSKLSLPTLGRIEILIP